jgi:hypothetical protein
VAMEECDDDNKIPNQEVVSKNMVNQMMSVDH